MRHSSIGQLRTGGPRRAAWRRGFTLIEMMMSILIIGILMALVIAGAVHVTRLAKDTMNQQAVRTISAAVTQFKTECGILPPLVKDKQPVNNMTVVIRGSGPNQKAYVNVFNFGDAADQLILRTKPTGRDATNPFGTDNRYSEQSLAIYLLGAMNALDIDNDLPLDGVIGTGLYKAQADGRFEVPDSVIAFAKNPTAGALNRGLGKVLGPYLEASTGKVVYKNSADEHSVQLVDAKNVPIRFYRWLQGVPDPANPGKLVVRFTADMNIPPLVGIDSSAGDYLMMWKWYPVPPDRDISKNPALKSAAWAVVGAGRNGAFGDESAATLTLLLGRTVDASNIQQARIEAASDNIVEVGQ